MKSYKKNMLFVIVGIVLIGAIVFGIYLNQSFSKEKVVEKTVKETTTSAMITEVDFTKLTPGTYNGKYELDGISVKVSVDIMDGKMENIQILSHQEDMNKTANTMIEHMVEQQKIDVDVVSGATTSNTLIKKAVENAVLK